MTNLTDIVSKRRERIRSIIKLGKNLMKNETVPNENNSEQMHKWLCCPDIEERIIIILFSLCAKCVSGSGLAKAPLGRKEDTPV